MTTPIFLMATRYAQAIVHELYIIRPSDINLDEIAVYCRIFPQECPLVGCDARLLLDIKRNVGIATINSSIPELGRKRFALAHEIGHFKLHRTIKSSWECTEYDFLKWYKGNDEEPEANTFAAELLMPSDIFKEHCRKILPSFSNIKELANLFNSSLTSTAIRFVEMGNYPCALVSSKDGKIAWFRRSQDFNYRLYIPGSEVHSESCVAECFSNLEFVQDKPEEVGTHCWLEDYDKCDFSFIYEDTIVIRRYNTVLSLIWVK